MLEKKMKMNFYNIIYYKLIQTVFVKIKENIIHKISTFKNKFLLIHFLLCNLVILYYVYKDMHLHPMNIFYLIKNFVNISIVYISTK